MRNPWFLFLLILLLATGAQMVLPWWSLAVVAFALAAWLGRTGGQAFLIGFGGAGLSWLLPALYFYQRNGGVLADRVAAMLPLGGKGWAVAVVGAALIGLVGGLAALTGYWLRQALWPQVNQRLI